MNCLKRIPLFVLFSILVFLHVNVFQIPEVVLTDLYLISFVSFIAIDAKIIVTNLAVHAILVKFNAPFAPVAQSTAVTDI
jgi:hypothetical protein